LYFPEKPKEYFVSVIPEEPEKFVNNQ